MGIVDLRTDLKSIKFGKDVVGGGNSNQPYVVRDIPESFQDVGRTGGPDFLLRGGTLLPRRVINDTSRMVQMLFDFKSPNGPLFIAKQNVLSLTNVNTAVGYVDQQDDAQTGVGKFIQDNFDEYANFLNSKNLKGQMYFSYEGYSGGEEYKRQIWKESLFKTNKSWDNLFIENKNQNQKENKLCKNCFK